MPGIVLCNAPDFSVEEYRLEGIEPLEKGQYRWRWDSPAARALRLPRRSLRAWRPRTHRGPETAIGDSRHPRVHMPAIMRTAAVSAATAAIVSGLIAYALLRHADTTGALVIQSHRALATTDEILRRAMDAEWGARGYAISRNRAYLAPFDRAARVIQARIDALQWLVDDASEHQDVERLRVEINGLFNTLRPMVRRAVTANDVDMGISDEAEPRIETIRRLVREIRQVETERLAARVAADESATRAVRVLATVMMGIGTALAAAAMFFTVWLVRPGWGRSAT